MPSIHYACACESVSILHGFISVFSICFWSHTGQWFFMIMTLLPLCQTFFFHTQISFLNTLFSHFRSNLRSSPIFLVLLSIYRKWNPLVLWVWQPLETTLRVHAMFGSALELFWDLFKSGKREEKQPSLISEMLGGEPATFSLWGNSANHCVTVPPVCKHYSNNWSGFLQTLFLWVI